MNDNPFINLYTSDFLAGTSGMTASTKGVYITLICLIYEDEKPLKHAWDMLARRCGCTKSSFKKAVQSLVDDGKITVSDDGIWSDKCEKHITLRRERQNSAKAAANKRWEKTKQKQGNADAPAYDPHCQPKPEPEVVKRDTKVSPKKAARLSPDWTLPKDWGEWAISEGWQEAAIRFEAEKFRDYWIGVGGQKGAKLDWQATWRNWMRNSKQTSLKAIDGGSQHGKPTSKSEERMRAFISGATNIAS